MKFCEIKEYAQPYVIAEIGANHNGDMELAIQMIDIAKECGADCVKFQSWTKESIFSRLVYDNNYFLNDDYRNRTDYTLEEIVDKYHIGKQQHIELKKYCGYNLTYGETAARQRSFLGNDDCYSFIGVVLSFRPNAKGAHRCSAY